MPLVRIMPWVPKEDQPYKVSGLAFLSPCPWEHDVGATVESPTPTSYVQAKLDGFLHASCPSTWISAVRMATAPSPKVKGRWLLWRSR